MLLLIIKENYGGGTGIWRWRSRVYPDMFYILIRHTNGEQRMPKEGWISRIWTGLGSQRGLVEASTHGGLCIPSPEVGQGRVACMRDIALDQECGPRMHPPFIFLCLPHNTEQKMGWQRSCSQGWAAGKGSETHTLINSTVTEDACLAGVLAACLALCEAPENAFPHFILWSNAWVPWASPHSSWVRISSYKSWSSRAKCYVHGCTCVC